MMNLKGLIAKSDVFHLFSGAWKTPTSAHVDGWFPPSELIKQSTHEAEEALSQGLEALNKSLSETIISDSLSISPNMNNYMAQMAVAINKLSTIEGFVRQAPNPSPSFTKLDDPKRRGVFQPSENISTAVLSAHHSLARPRHE
ncbi:hypothetical protein DH2020_038891 [Rehmannia glutinosa]|uniref:Uncharacterized protein n=1 Tax=Rehmannia glutinosa TaxID=99300 RepID=A0ABR0UZJ1_REHGL